ncbi:MAG: hypothetical protein M3Y72_14420 [Acidobacteriota bacterium]|nr:hypothetical protein [Acidobacteriota bacterium]
MEQASLSPLAGWANFYVIAGSSAGALTGLQFVVMTLIAESRKPGSMQEVRAFGTPTMVHFCAALLISAIMSVPWPSFSNLDFCIGVCGALGVAYALRVLWHARKAAYAPDLEDWIWYGALPLFSYAVLAAAAALLWWQPILSLFVIAATTLLFLFIGIHNAWDTVTYVALQQRQGAVQGEIKNPS